MISRIRRATQGLPTIIRSASNPGNIGHTWVRKRFVEPWRWGYKGLFDEKSNTYRIFIPSKATDNPHIMDNDPNYVNRLRLLPIAEQKSKIDGDWWAYSGQVFDEFRMQRYPDEPENAVHLCPYFPIPQWWPKYIAIDWGYTAMTVAYWFAVSPDARLFVYREYSCTKKSPEVWGADILRASQFDGNIKFATLDPSAWQNRGEQKLIWMQVQDALGHIGVKQADNDRVGGKLAIHELLRWQPRPVRYVPKEGYRADRYDQIFRMSGLKAALEYRKMFDPEVPEVNLPKLQILEGTCPLLVDVIPTVVYEDPKKDGKRPEDVKEFDGDDPYDAFRYGAKEYESLVTESTGVGEEIRRTSEMMKLAETDMYSFYRQMERNEKKGKGDVIRPNHRRFGR
jgi:hypothetical protein